MPQLTEEQRFAISVYESITSLFDEDGENYQYDINSIDLSNEAGTPICDGIKGG